MLRSVCAVLQPLFLFPRAMSQVLCLHEHLTNAARVKYPVACSGVFDFSTNLEVQLRKNCKWNVRVINEINAIRVV